MSGPTSFPKRPVSFPSSSSPARPSASGKPCPLVNYAKLTNHLRIVNTVQSVFLSKEIKELAPNVDFELVRQSVSAIFTLPVDEQGPVIEAYIIAITESLIPIIAAMGLAWIIAMCIKNHNMKEKGAAHGAMA
jgi:hypothetical protein